VNRNIQYHYHNHSHIPVRMDSLSNVTQQQSCPHQSEQSEPVQPEPVQPSKPPKTDISLDLLYAAKVGNTRNVRRLIAKGLNLNVQDKFLMTPLHHAAKYGHLPVVKLLVIAHAKMEIVNGDACTPLHIAAFYGHVDILLFLLRFSANPNCTDKFNRTPLQSAVINGHINVVNYLLCVPGIDITIRNNRGETNLHKAAGYGHLHILIHLMACKVKYNKSSDLSDPDGDIDPNGDYSVDSVDIYGATALNHSIAFGHVEVAEYLIQSGANINGVGSLMLPPLHHAVVCRRYNMIRLLMAYGADVNLVFDEKSPVDFAIDVGNKYIVDMLVFAGARINYLCVGDPAS